MKTLSMTKQQLDSARKACISGSSVLREYAKKDSHSMWADASVQLQLLHEFLWNVEMAAGGKCVAIAMTLPDTPDELAGPVKAAA